MSTPTSSHTARETDTALGGASARLAAAAHRRDLHARFAPVFARIAAESATREAERTLPFDQVDWLRDAGFLAVQVPVEFGGLGASSVEFFELLVLLAEADSNLPQLLRAHFTTVESWLVREPGERRAFWLRQIAGGAVFGNATHERSAATVGTYQTTLSRENGRARLDGTKHYSTGSIYADWILVTATDAETGEQVSVTVAADAAGVDRRDDWDGFGQRLTGSGTTVFTNVTIDPEHIDVAHAATPSHITGFLELVLLASIAGIGRAALRDARDFVASRTRVYSQGVGTSAREDPLVQQVIGQISGLVFAAESAVLAAAAEVGEASDLALFEAASAADSARELPVDSGENHHGEISGEPSGTPTAAHTAESTRAIRAAETAAIRAQLQVPDLVLRATTALFEVGGASATARERNLDRHWRNARVLSSHNPVIYQARALGDDLLNGDGLLFTWATGEGTPAATA
ncbi:acyl-CoA dehydrogenase family protein [Mycetocola saprophilus]|uniref:acyl-CoA dehydrogenase family protein n=1 Tax=Mycetocola saprophilus TaxID=76636 RepID=UPI0009DD8471|nr:acyl-CoA dehydrogenase family protein [Mycetocola saprophilus]